MRVRCAMKLMQRYPWPIVLGMGMLGALVLAVACVQVHNLRVSLDAALDTAGSLQVHFVECEGDRLKLQASMQQCDTQIESLKADTEATYDEELVAARRYRRTSYNPGEGPI